jgi:hypothetical protein
VWQLVLLLILLLRGTTRPDGLLLPNLAKLHSQAHDRARQLSHR